MIPLPKSLFFNTPHACSRQEAVALRRQLLGFGFNVRRPLRFAPPFVTFCPVIHLDLDRPQSVRTVCWPTLPRSRRARKSFVPSLIQFRINAGAGVDFRQAHNAGIREIHRHVRIAIQEVSNGWQLSPNRNHIYAAFQHKFNDFAARHPFLGHKIANLGSTASHTNPPGGI